VQALGLLKQRGKQRTDSTHILAAIRTMNRLERVGETLRAALNSLAVAALEWLRTVADPEWFKLCGRRIENFNLPKTEAERTQLAAVIDSDGKRLLQAIAISDARESLGKLDAVTLLERMWEEQFVEENGQLRFREVKEMPSPATLITNEGPLVDGIEFYFEVCVRHFAPPATCVGHSIRGGRAWLTRSHRGATGRRANPPPESGVRARSCCPGEAASRCPLGSRVPTSRQVYSLKGVTLPR
jgi:hypothetical protein